MPLRLITLIVISIPLFLSADDRANELNYAKGLINTNIFSNNSFQSHFEQIIRDEQGEIIDKMDGTISIMKPDNFRWHYKNPYEQIIIGNGVKLISYDIDLNDITIRDYRSINNTVPIIMLKSDEDSVNDLKLINSYYDSENLFWVTAQYQLSNNDEFVFDVAFSNKVIAKMLIKDSLNQDMIINFLNPVINTKLDSDLFDIEAMLLKSEIGQ
tara:strand:- start:5755 stop:6393 length:639 start_codon:yes stop_codon:yes gene_type:complete